MNEKPWYKQKTTIFGIAGFIGGLVLAFTGNTEGVALATLSLTQIFQRQRTEEIAKEIKKNKEKGK